MISTPPTRSELASQIGAEGKELSAAIRAMKQCGKLIQRRVSVGPTTLKKKVVFNFVATNLNLEV